MTAAIKMDKPTAWKHPDVLALRAQVNLTDPRDRKAYKAALNAIRDRMEELCA